MLRIGRRMSLTGFCLPCPVASSWEPPNGFRLATCHTWTVCDRRTSSRTGLLEPHTSTVHVASDSCLAQCESAASPKRTGCESPQTLSRMRPQRHGRHHATRKQRRREEPVRSRSVDLLVVRRGSGLALPALIQMLVPIRIVVDPVRRIGYHQHRLRRA